MADETPPDTTPQQRAPVRMGLRVVARHSAGRHGGRALAHEVVEAHRPKHLAASTRLKPVAARSVAPPPVAPPAAEFAYDAPAAPSGPAAPAPAAPGPAPRELPRGMSDFAAQWLFGDQSEAQDSLMSMAEAEKLREPTKEERVARFIARGGLERSRGARIVEGAASGTPLSPDELGVADEPEPAPKKLSRTPAAAAPSTSPSVTTPAPSGAARERGARSEAPRRRLSRSRAGADTPTPTPASAPAPSGSAPVARTPASPGPASVARTPAA